MVFFLLAGAFVRHISTDSGFRLLPDRTRIAMRDAFPVRKRLEKQIKSIAKFNCIVKKAL